MDGPIAPRPGVVRCLGLGCNAEFTSPDRRSIRFCPKCRPQHVARAYGLRDVSVRQVHGAIRRDRN